MAIHFKYIYNRRNKLHNDGTAPIFLYVSLNRQKKYLNTGIHIRPEEWDSEKRLVNRKHVNHIHINAVLKRKLADIEQWYYNQINTGRPVSIHKITLDHGGSRLSFYQYATNDLEKDSVAPSTRRVYLITLNAFQDFAPNVPLTVVTRELIDEFEYDLKRKDLHPNTIHRYLRQIRRFLNKAEEQEYINENQNPFRKKRLHKVKTEPKYLDPEIVDRLANVEFNEPHLCVIRDMFMFSVYTGLRYSDMFSLQKSDIYESQHGLYIQKEMQKTLNRKMTKVYIPLWAMFNGSAERLVYKYIDEERDKVFPNLTNEHINRELKRIWKKLNVAPIYTFHSARHTCATYLLYKGVNIKIVQKILGHEDLKTTEVYARVLRKTIDNELYKVSW